MPLPPATQPCSGHATQPQSSASPRRTPCPPEVLGDGVAWRGGSTLHHTHQGARRPEPGQHQEEIHAKHAVQHTSQRPARAQRLGDPHGEWSRERKGGGPVETDVQCSVRMVVVFSVRAGHAGTAVNRAEHDLSPHRVSLVSSLLWHDRMHEPPPPQPSPPPHLPSPPPPAPRGATEGAWPSTSCSGTG